MSRELPELVSAWETGAAFRAEVGEADGVRTFFHPVRDAADLPPEATPNAIISVSLRFRDKGLEFHVHARVLERRGDGAPFGLRLAFLPEEHERQELVLASAEGESVPYLRRKAVRTPCDLDADVTLPDGKTVRSKLSTISERGAHVSIDALAADERIELHITFPSEQVHVRGRITAALAGPQHGAGVEFIFSSSKQRDAVAATVAKFRAGLPS